MARVAHGQTARVGCVQIRRLTAREGGGEER